MPLFNNQLFRYGKWLNFCYYYWTLQGFFVISFTPITIKIDRNWIIESNKAVGSEINRVHHLENGKNISLVYSLEPGPSGFQPFWIDRDHGIIYLKQSLRNDAHKNFSVLIKAVNKQFESIPSKIEVHVTVIEPNKIDSYAYRMNLTSPTLYFLTVTLMPQLTLNMTSTMISTQQSLLTTTNTSNEYTLVHSTNLFNKSQTHLLERPFNYINQYSSIFISIGVLLIVIIISLTLSLYRKRIASLLFKNSKNHMYEKNNFVKSISILNNPVPAFHDQYHDWGRQRALSNRYDSTPWEQLQLQQNMHNVKFIDDQYEFPRHRLKFFDIIGEGAFGQVWKCEATDSNGNVKVIAVKTLKENANSKEKKDLICEMLIMKNLKPHTNVVRLLGCCTEKEPYFLLMEYIDGGKLQSFLRECRNLDHRYYLNRNNILSNNGTNHIITSHNLTSYVYQVAKGMAFLAENNIVHRDLAARNVLITSDGTCKVADFGFARDIASNHIYERKSEGRLPIRWMAIESLYDNIFTTKSDVWAFGIFMWEVVTLGSTPYPGLSASEVMKKVKDGYRLEKPEHCRRELYNVMYYCWTENANVRPTFHELIELLEKLILTETDYIELERFPDHSYYNIIHLSGEKV